jgi:hypothetical protein
MPTRPQRDAQIPDIATFYGDLVGGVDLNSSPTALPSYKAQMLRNYSLHEAGALVTSEGFVLFTPTPLPVAGQDRIQGGDRIYLTSGVPMTLVAYNGGIYQVFDSGAWSPLLQGGLDPFNEIYFGQDGKVVMVFDGVHRPLLSADGTTWFQVGISAPLTAPTLSLLAGGSLLTANEYEVTYTFRTSAAFNINLVHESNESPRATIVVTAPNQTIQVQGFGSDDPKVDTIDVYARNLTTGQILRRSVTSTTNTDSVTLWTASFSLPPSGLALPPPLDADLPEAFRYGFFWRNRWWAFHPTVMNRLHFSEVFQPQMWPVDYFIDLPMIRGDELRASTPIGDILSLLGAHGIFLLSMPTTLELDVRPALSVETGAFGPRASISVEAGVIHAGSDGVYLFNGSQDTNISADIQTGWHDMVINTAPSILGKIAVTLFERLSQVHVGVPRIYPLGVPGEYLLDLIRMKARGEEAWVTTTKDNAGFIPFNGNEPTVGNFGRLLTWPKLGGILNEDQKGAILGGAPMVSVFTTAAFTTQFRETMLIHGFIEYQPAEGTLTVELFVNGRLINTQVFGVAANVAVYGTAIYGASPYGSLGRRKRALMFPLPADGTDFFLRLTFNGGSRFKLFSYGFGAVPEPVIRTLTE